MFRGFRGPWPMERVSHTTDLRYQQIYKSRGLRKWIPLTKTIPCGVYVKHASRQGDTF